MSRVPPPPANSNDGGENRLMEMKMQMAVMWVKMTVVAVAGMMRGAGMQAAVALVMRVETSAVTCPGRR